MKNVKEISSRVKRPVRVVQFGEGNFLRAFADWMLDIAAERGKFDGSVALVQPIPFGTLDSFDAQDYFYTVVLRGKVAGKTVNDHRIVSVVDRAVNPYRDYADYAALARERSVRLIISNTTEAGIVFDDTDLLDSEPPKTYPGKLTKFLFERYSFFGGDPDSGVVILPVELIENNGGELYSCVKKFAELWKLPAGFTDWLDSACLFCSTLVDRIVTGYPKGKGEPEAVMGELGWEDRLLDVCEPFALWVIATDDIPKAKAAVDFEAAGLPVIYTDDVKPYRDRKVRILNGAHTSFVPAAYLAGQNIVRECMRDGVVRPFIDAAVYREIVPGVALPPDEVKRFADSVAERFDNPFIDHALISIALNSVSKWRARVLPSVEDFVAREGRTPPCLTMSFAALCEFYARGREKDGGFFGTREAGDYEIRDDTAVIGFFRENGQADDVVLRFAKNEAFWGRDLTAIPGFSDGIVFWHGLIRRDGTAAAMKRAAGEWR